jgi:hypothetical protein
MYTNSTTGSRGPAAGTRGPHLTASGAGFTRRARATGSAAGVKKNCDFFLEKMLRVPLDN